MRWQSSWFGLSLLLYTLAACNDARQAIKKSEGENLKMDVHPTSILVETYDGKPIPPLDLDSVVIPQIRTHCYSKAPDATVEVLIGPTHYESNEYHIRKEYIGLVQAEVTFFMENGESFHGVGRYRAEWRFLKRKENMDSILMVHCVYHALYIAQEEVAEQLKTYPHAE